MTNNSHSSPKLPIYRKLGRAYLVFTGILYFLTGIDGLIDSEAIFAAMLWYSRFLVQPFPLFNILQNCSNFPSCSIYGFSYATELRPLERHFWMFNLCVIGLGAISIWAARAAARDNGIAKLVWFFISLFATFAAMGNIWADLANWGAPPFKGTVTHLSIAQLVLATSYLVASALVSIPGNRATNSQVVLSS